MRVLIAVEGCEAHRDRWEAQRATWARDCDFVHFFTGPELGVPDDYAHLPEKTKAICSWALGHGVDHLFKADTDLYLHPTRLLLSGFERRDYTGYVLDWIAERHYCSGPHYWLSRRALQMLHTADWDKHRIAGVETCEDVTVGSVLHAYGILPVHDPRYAPFESVLPQNDVISSHLSSREPFKLEFMYAAHKRALGS